MLNRNITCERLGNHYSLYIILLLIQPQNEEPRLIVHFNQPEIEKPHLSDFSYVFYY